MTPGAEFHMWAVLALIGLTIVLYAIERPAMEVTSIGILALLVLLFSVFPLEAADGRPVDAKRLLSGFADPALITVLALLVVGQAIVQTGALERAARWVAQMRRHHPLLAIWISLLVALGVSAVLNNTPVVVIFIPIMTAIAERLHRNVSTVMMPLSFAAILGGMTTLMGSSTNLLVSGAIADLGLPALGFFDFTVPGLALASVGFLYVIFVMPKLLPDRRSLTRSLVDGDGKQFIAQITVPGKSPLVGEKGVAGRFPGLSEMTVRMIQRGEHPLLPPFDDTVLQADDVVVVAATRAVLTRALSERTELVPENLHGAEDREGVRYLGQDQILAEVVVAPASRMIGRDLAQIGFHYQTNCVVLGVQRRSRMYRARMDEIRLDAGDVLLVLGGLQDLIALRASPDVLLLEWSTRELPARTHAKRALVIFGATVAAAATGLLPIVAAALAGAGAMVAAGCLNVRQAARAADRQVILLVGTTLALGSALQATGGAAFLAHGMIELLSGASVAVVLSAFFLLVAVMTNVISNNGTAVLFTPIAVNTAYQLGVEPMIFVFTVIFAANCSFATPIGYQTNLLVMGPGHYRFADFLKAGGPLILVIWLTFSLFAPWYYELG